MMQFNEIIGTSETPQKTDQSALQWAGVGCSVASSAPTDVRGIFSIAIIRPCLVSMLHHIQHQLLWILQHLFEAGQEFAGHGTVNQPVIE
jgi:hypothetical protein